MSDPNITAKIASAMKNLSRPKLNKEDCYEFDKLTDHGNSSKSWNFSSCLFIACHLSTSTSEEAKQLEATLRAALVHFPANHIFVCDNANVYSPPDKTESLVKKIHPEINYLYIPIGNKSFAFYWTEKYWLSHLQKNGIVSMSAGKYIVTIDDDVCLPNNFFVPTNHLDVNHEIAAVQYQVVPISSSSQRGKRPLLTGFQYLEYMALSNIPEIKSPMPYKLSNSWEWFMWCPPLYCSGALGVWRREDFNRIMSKHDSYFHGEDLQMGLLLIEEGSRKRMVACSNQNVVIPTVAPNTLGDFFRQRVKSCELINFMWGANFYFSNAWRSMGRSRNFGHQTSAKVQVYFLSKGISLVLSHDPSTPMIRLVLFLILLPHLDDRKHDIIVLFEMMIISILLNYFRYFIYHLHTQPFMKSFRKPSLLEWSLLPLYGILCDTTTYLAGIYHLSFEAHQTMPSSMSARENFGDIPPCPQQLPPQWDRVWIDDCNDEEDISTYPWT